jgi:N-acetylmuramoyl-L-alanine amidase
MGPSPASDIVAPAELRPSLGTAIPIASSARVEARGPVTRLVFTLDSPVSARAYVLAGPDRVVVDLSQVDFRIDPSVGRAPAAATGPRRAMAGAIESFRFGLIEPGKSRIVVDLARPVRVVEAAMRPDGGGKSNFVLELADTQTEAFATAAAAPPLVPTANADAASVAVALPPPSAAAEPMVVLDPGHGGIDTGALGPRGIEEKNVTLAFADTLAAILRSDGRVRVTLTRDSDVFVPLEKRVAIARKAAASLFMSIHADTIKGAGSVAGATVYTLSDKASDREAARVAASENDADAAAGLTSVPSADEDEVKDILFDLTRRETRTYSNFFADSLMKTWSTAADLNHNPHRSARFVVLKAPDVPSVLLELGYLSSGKDVRSLTSASWRQQASVAAAKAIEAFFDARGTSAAAAKDTAIPGPNLAPVALEAAVKASSRPPGSAAAP